VDVLELEGLLVQHRRVRVARPLPRRRVGEVLVVSPSLSVLRLVLGPEVATAALLAVERIPAHEHGQLEEVVDPSRLLEGLVDARTARDPEVRAELGVQGGDLTERLLQPFGRALHTAEVPHEPAQLPVEPVDRARALDGEVALEPFTDLLLRSAERGIVGRHRLGAEQR
jgi:hypothetical protein